METDDRRTPDHELGPWIGEGRDAVIHALGADRVLRRTPDQRDHTAEADVMEHVRAAGYPVPQVFRVGPGELVLARIDGQTMLEDLEAHPWRYRRHARTLADLHLRLHRIDAPAGLRQHPLGGGHAVLHQDLHPGNVMCSRGGPVVIDWTNAAQGDPAVDVALSWILMASFELDEGAGPRSTLRRFYQRAEGVAIRRIRRQLVSTFLRSTGMETEARRVLAATAEERMTDRNVRPGEAVAIRTLVEREVPATGP